MNEVKSSVPPASSESAAPLPRKPYVPPVLTLFGHVAALTQGSNCSASNDGSGSCAMLGGTEMGMT